MISKVPEVPATHRGSARASGTRSNPTCPRKVPEVPATPPSEQELTRRAASLADRYSKLTIEQLRTKYANAADRAHTTPTWWATTAKTESLAVTIALELLATDQTAGDPQPAQEYLTAARHAAATLATKPPATRRPPPEGIPL